MKKLSLALGLLSIAGIAQAQSSVTLYGTLDIGMVKVKDRTTAIGRGDNNKLGFKGVEDLGGGLSAIFQLETRFEPDTGTTEAAPNRPLFQGESRVGLKGDFGTIRLGRGLSAVQDDNAIRAFEPWGAVSNRATLYTFLLAGYNGDPLNPGSSQNRFSNGVFYNSPVVGSGFQFNASWATKEALGVGTPKTNPYSFSTTYNNGPFSGMVGYERNAIDTEFSNIAGAYTNNNLKLFTTYAQQKISLNGMKTKGYILGANYTVGSGVILAGYGRNKHDNFGKTDQISIGYEHNLSKRTYLYVDAYQRKAPGVSNTHSFDVGIHHNF
jgi:predicted porin